MKVSFVLTVSAQLTGLILATGCAERRPIRVQEPARVHEAVTPSRPGPEVQTVALSSGVPLAVAAPPAAVANPPAGELVLHEAPPPPQVEVVGPAPDPSYIWMPGRWEWRGHWFWKSGRWAVSPGPQARWVPGTWTRNASGWSWRNGYWR